MQGTETMEAANRIRRRRRNNNNPEMQGTETLHRTLEAREVDATITTPKCRGLKRHRRSRCGGRRRCNNNNPEMQGTETGSGSRKTPRMAEATITTPKCRGLKLRGIEHQYGT